MSGSIRRLAAAVATGAVVLGTLALAPSASSAPPSGSPSDYAGDPGAVAALWTPEARAAAIPRDLVIDERGLGYLKRADGSLEPYGHSTPAAAATPKVVAMPTSGQGSAPSPAKGKPGSGSDTIKPSVSVGSPSDGSILTGATTFSATVTDNVGVRSVAFEYSYNNGSWITATGQPSQSGNTWSQTITSFSPDGSWRFRVTAKDTSGNTSSSTISFMASFTGSGGTSGGGSSGIVTNSVWPGTGTVQTAAGRIYFYMPANKAQSRWTGYVCSGTVVSDNLTGASVVMTAAHCVYDDVNKAFARDAMFIPDQSASNTKTDRNCGNDKYGCWVASYGVVDREWTTRTFPDNIPWDYAYYVLPDSSHQSGSADNGTSLETAVGALGINFTDTTPADDDPAQALGYSYSDDPNFMYCSEALATEGSYGDWWLGQCGLSGGASGGPWQPKGPGDAAIFSVNSWGYTNQPGMAGPKLSGSAPCVYGKTGGSPVDRGVIAVC
jgi:Bacterial Ig domain